MAKDISRLSRRHLSVWCPRLALDIWRRREDPRLQGPFAVTLRVGGAERIHRAGDRAQDAGVRDGESVTDARAVCPDLLCEPCDPVREASLLAAIRTWCDRFAPRVALEPPDGLTLDVTGCAHLFGGERALAEAVRDGLAALHVAARIGVANTPLAARGFARHGREPITVTDPEAEVSAIASLPIAALGVESEAERTLARLGLHTVADLSALSSSQLARRVSVRVPDALHRLRGERADPIVPSAMARPVSASRRLAEPVRHLEPIQHVLEALVHRVCADLKARGKAARRFHLDVFHANGRPEPIEVGFARPTREVAAITRQFTRPLDALRLPFGADRFRLVAHDVELFAHVQADLSSWPAEVEGALDQTLTTIGNRVGFDRLLRPVAGRGHAPEAEHLVREALSSRLAKSCEALAYYPRPERVWTPERVRVEVAGNPPLRFTWRGQEVATRRADGPERVCPEWWRDGHDMFSRRVRDYFRITTEDGRTLWLMTFASPAQGARPEWFCCGEFLLPPRVVAN